MATQPFINPHTGTPVDFVPFGSDGQAGAAVRNFGNPQQLREVLEKAGLWEKFTKGREPPPLPARTQANRGQGPSEQEQAYADWLKDVDWSALDGYSLGQSRQDYNVTQQLRAPDGTVISGTPVHQRESWNSDDWQELAVNSAMVLGGGYLAGNALAANGIGAGVGGATTGAGASAGAGGATLTGTSGSVNAALIESAAGAAGYGGSSGLGGLITATGAPGLAGAAAAGASGAGGSVVDPISQYLTTGASEGSTLGNAISGAGGASGAVGPGTLANTLGNLGSVGQLVDSGSRLLTGEGLQQAATSAGSGVVDRIGSAIGNSSISDWLQIGGALLPTVAGIATRPDAANTGAITAASDRNATMAQRQQQVAEDQFGQLTALFEQYRPMLQQQITSAQALQQGVTQAAADEWSDYRTIWRPVQNRLAEESLAMANPERYEQEGMRAAGDVTTQFDRARTDTRRELEMSGASQEKIAQLEAAGRLTEAKAVGGAQAQGRRDARSVAMDYLGRAAQFGRQLPQTATQLAGLSSDLAGRTTQSINNLTLASAQPAQIAANLYQGAGNLNSSAGSLASQANRDQATSDIARSNATLGGLAGSARIIGSLFGD